MRSVVLCVATAKGLAVVKSLKTLANRPRITVCTFREQDVAECFHEQIQAESLSAGFTCIDYSLWKKDAAAVVQEVEAEGILCIGWRYLIPQQVVQQVNGNVIVAHDSLLPKFRGFAPLPTALICGEHEAGVTFLQATDRVDAGPIYWQGRFAIEPNDTIQQLIDKTLPLYIEGSLAAVSGQFPTPFSQDETKATYSIWRDELDYLVDWNLDAETIVRMIRALGPPFLKAQTVLQHRRIFIRDATVTEDLKFAIRQPGKVWSLDGSGCPGVVCGSGMVKILDAAYEDGKPFIPMRQLRVRFG